MIIFGGVDRSGMSSYMVICILSNLLQVVLHLLHWYVVTFSKRLVTKCLFNACFEFRMVPQILHNSSGGFSV